MSTFLFICTWINVFVPNTPELYYYTYTTSYLKYAQIIIQFAALINIKFEKCAQNKYFIDISKLKKKSGLKRPFSSIYACNVSRTIY